MGYLNIFLPLLKTLGAALTKLFLGIFLVNVGKEKQQLADYEKEQKNVRETKKITDNINDMSDDRINELYLKSIKDNSNKK